MKSILKKAKAYKQHFFQSDQQTNGGENTTTQGEHDKIVKDGEEQHNGANEQVVQDGVEQQPQTQGAQNNALPSSQSSNQIHQSPSNADIVSSTPKQQSHLNNNDISIASANLDSSLTTPLPSSENLANLSGGEQQSNTQPTPNNTVPASPSSPNNAAADNTTTTTTTTTQNVSPNKQQPQPQSNTPTPPPPPPPASISHQQQPSSSTSLLVSTFSKFKIKLGSGGKNKDNPSSAPNTPHNNNPNNVSSNNQTTPPNKHRSTTVITPGTINSNNHQNQNNKTPDHPEEPKQVEKEVITISQLSDFPDDCQKLIRISGIPEEKLIKNIQILAYVLHFRTGRFFKLLDEPPREPRKKFVSDRFNDGEKLLEHVEPAILKKMYKDSDQVGKGGFGTVYFAKSTKEKRLVAIKKMPHITKRQQQQNYREAAILAYCDHPNIVKLHTCHIDKDSNLWIIMEFMEGGTFEEAAKAWKFNENNLAYVAKELLKGLQYLHANGMVHRDLKSANIMMSVEGKVKLIDFGLCEDISTSTPMHMVGSPFWMAPEMIQQKYHSTPVDIWSFAISLLEMANQRPPMMESAVKAMFTVATDGATGFDDPALWSDCFKDFLSLCLKQDPADRATAEDLLKHQFIKKADSRDNMENILKKIFLTNSLMNSGF